MVRWCDGAMVPVCVPAQSRRCRRLLGVQVRAELVPNPSDPVWSGYTCFAAIAQCVPDDIKEVGYKIYIGPRKYFVSVDVGGGRIQWYASPHNSPTCL